MEVATWAEQRPLLSLLITHPLPPHFNETWTRAGRFQHKKPTNWSMIILLWEYVWLPTKFIIKTTFKKIKLVFMKLANFVHREWTKRRPPPNCICSRKKVQPIIWTVAVKKSEFICTLDSRNQLQHLITRCGGTAISEYVLLRSSSSDQTVSMQANHGQNCSKLVKILLD